MDLDALIKAVEEKPMEEVCVQFGTNIRRVRYVLSENGLHIRGIRHTYRKKQIPILLASGMSKTAVRLKLGLSKFQVKNTYTDLYDPHHIPVEELPKMVELLQTKPLGAVADLYGVDRSSMSRFIKKHGYNYKEIVGNYRTNFIKEHLAHGYSLNDIAKLLGISSNQIYCAYRNGVYNYLK